MKEFVSDAWSLTPGCVAKSSKLKANPLPADA
jgi:hypothetical protein